MTTGNDKKRLTLGLTGLEENVRDDLVDLTDKLEKRVLGQVLEGELSLSSVSGVLVKVLARFQKQQGGSLLTVFLRTAWP